MSVETAIALVWLAAVVAYAVGKGRGHSDGFERGREAGFTAGITHGRAEEREERQAADEEREARRTEEVLAEQRAADRERREFLTALERELPGTLQRPAASGMDAAALADAAVAAGMAIYARYPRLKAGSWPLSESDAPGTVAAALVDILAQWENCQDVVDRARSPKSTDVSELLFPDLDLLPMIIKYRADRALVRRLSSLPDRPWEVPWAGREGIIATADAITEIGLSRGGMMAPAPTYHLTLRRDGPAEYGGEYLVEHLGRFEADLPAGAFDDLARAVMYVALATSLPLPLLVELRECDLGPVPYVTDLERRIVRLRLGLEDGRAWTLEDCARELSISCERIFPLEFAGVRERNHVVSDSRLGTGVDLIHGGQPLTITSWTYGDEHPLRKVIEQWASDLVWRPEGGQGALVEGAPWERAESDSRPGTEMQTANTYVPAEFGED